MSTFTTRRYGFDRDAARDEYNEGQRRRIKGVPRVGDKVVMSLDATACVYTVTEVFQRTTPVSTAIMVVLMYPGLDGVMRNGGTVDACLLMTPSAEQTEQECI